MSRIIEPFARNEYIYISKQLKIRWSVMYVKYRLKYRQVSNWRFDVWLHPFELFTQAVSYQRSVSTTSLVKSIFWKLCYTTLFQLIYPTRKKVKRMFTKRRKLGIGSQKSHGLGRDFLELQLLQFFFYNKRAFFLLCYIWGNCLRFLQPPLPPLSLYRWSVPKATTFLRACYPC